MSALKYWVWLASLSGIGAVTAGRLLEHFGSPENIFNASDENFIGIKDIRTRRSIIPDRKSIKEAEKIIAACAQKQFKILTFDDKEYPNRLNNIYDPPIVLYINGKFTKSGLTCGLVCDIISCKF